MAQRARLDTTIAVLRSLRNDDVWHAIAVRLLRLASWDVSLVEAWLTHGALQCKPNDLGHYSWRLLVISCELVQRQFGTTLLGDALPNGLTEAMYYPP